MCRFPRPSPRYPRGNWAKRMPVLALLNTAMTGESGLWDVGDALEIVFGCAATLVGRVRQVFSDAYRTLRSRKTINAIMRIVPRMPPPIYI
jgi:hypothetical protein